MSTNKFKVEFILFNKNDLLTSYQINQRNKLLHEDMKNILTSMISSEYKVETNPDLIIRSLYINLKLSMNLENNDNQYSIFFEQVNNITLYSFEASRFEQFLNLLSCKIICSCLIISSIKIIRDF